MIENKKEGKTRRRMGEMNTSNISVNTQSSIRIVGSMKLYFDPFKISSAEHDADIVFITHGHYDQL